MNASSYLPSVTFRYTLGAVIIAALLILGAYALSKDQGGAPVAVDSAPVASADSSADRDQDGLKDWEEELIGADPGNPDTDGDGTRDGEEVQAGRDPLLKGPNDKVSGGIPAASGTATSTATDLFARQIFAKFSASKGAGETFSGGDLQGLINAALVTPTDEKPRFYTAAEIPTRESSPTTLREYGNAMGAILKKYPPKNQEGELVIFERALRTENDAELDKLAPIINTYAAILGDMLAIRVPKDAVGAHLDVLNGLSRVTANIRGMSRTFEDPVVGMQAFSQYPKNIELMMDAFAVAAALFEEKGVNFDSSESGSLFVNVFNNR